MSTMKFLLVMGQHGKKAAKLASLNLLGYEVDLSNVRRGIPKMLNLPEGKRIELIAPSREQFELNAVIMLSALDLGAEKAIHVHMDPTKLAPAFQFCQQRKCYVGGDMANPAVPVTSGQLASDMVEKMANLVPADQANIIAISPSRSGYTAFEPLCGRQMLE